jgi:hypothetical protein
MLIATLALVLRVVLEYSSSKPYDSLLYAPGVIDASSVPSRRTAPSSRTKRVFSATHSNDALFWLDLCIPCSTMTKASSKLGYRGSLLSARGLATSSGVLAPLL